MIDDFVRHRPIDAGITNDEAQVGNGVVYTTGERSLSFRNYTDGFSGDTIPDGHADYFTLMQTEPVLLDGKNVDHVVARSVEILGENRARYIIISRLGKPIVYRDATAGGVTDDHLIKDAVREKERVVELSPAETVSAFKQITGAYKEIAGEVIAGHQRAFEQRLASFPKSST